MKTTHQVFFDTIQNCGLERGSVDLVVTSPPYPMIEMWDKQFIESYPDIGYILNHQKMGRSAHFLMLHTLEAIWRTCEIILKPGGFLCINIGDATRRVDSDFMLYDNHTPIAQFVESLGFHQLPRIIWRKQTNAPNKFMGSGTLPLRAYVTLEHEFILIFRKGWIGIDKEREKRRKRSSIFWEERNRWYSDLWDFKGTKQNKNGHRTAAFPFELAHRLINMFSVQGDLVVDPFLGSGTTTAAAVVNGRNSMGFEVNHDLRPVIIETLKDAKLKGTLVPIQRKRDHRVFFSMDKHTYAYTSKRYGPVKTKQEIDMRIPILKSFKVLKPNNYVCSYK